MNPAQARQLIKDTFTRPFDRDRFRLFAVNVLNRMDESKKGNMQVPDAFAAHVKSCQRLATYTDPQGELLDVLVVHTTEDWKIERTRTALRDFVAHKLKRGENYKEAGLVAFVAPDAARWRLSYVRMQYESVRDPKTGLIKPEERVTPARRFSYLVGEGESCHTAQTRFLDLLQDTSTDPTLAQIEEAFSVEAVTKEFFAKYAELFGDINAALEKMVAKDKMLRDEFASKGVNTVDFAKKLLGQIVFLYFLQKKGWLGVEKGKDWGAGPRDFLRRLVDRSNSSDQSNLFNNVLEPLFYDTLATDRGHEAWCPRFKCRIPFLNGGLFEPLNGYDWKKTDILIPNRLFTNDDPVEEGITGTGVLDVFDRYNFTVNEAEPLEKEVAIDPEMLGKVFENLIEENRRKGLGAFYTPREIVHYMCQESLINYLETSVPAVPRADLETFVRLGDQIAHYEAVETAYKIKMPKSIEQNARALDDALKTITVCDPAVGSGAFPVGMMTEIVRCRMALNPYLTVAATSPSLTSVAAASSPLKISGGDAASTAPAARTPLLHYFDPDEPIGNVKGGNLPHWRQDGAMYFVTFRTADSMPEGKVAQWKTEREQWLAQHPEPHSPDVRREYYRLFHERWQNWLDEPHGACHLAQPEIKRLVENALKHFDGQHYRLDEYVVMPNHVHVLVIPRGEHTLSEIVQNWKSFTAHEINKRLGLHGPFWQKESFDHIVRSAQQAERIRQYIRDNPKKVEAASPPLESVATASSSLKISGEDAASTVFERTPYHFKRQAIQNCLYGVDIDSSAVEIAKLRLWLSLVVDEEDVKQVKPLPNLDYKIVVGNSLLGVEKDLFNQAAFQKLEKLKPRYFDQTDPSEKSNLRRQINALIHELTRGHETFDFEIFFSEVFHQKGGFDVVIANPPYVRQEKIKDHKQALKAGGYECYDGAADLLVYFYERAVKLLRKGGVLTFITSNKYYRAGYGEKLRGFLARELTLHRLIDFGDAPVFEAIAYASILIGLRNAPSKDAAPLAYTWETGLDFDGISSIVAERGRRITQSDLKPDGWRLESPLALRLFEKIKRTGTPLSDYVKGRFYYGIKTGLNEAFVVDRATRDRLIREHKSSAEVLKPFLRGRDVKRWRCQPQDLWLIFTRRGIDITKYPAIHEHLKQFKKRLMPGAPGGRKPGSYEWYEIQDNIAYWQEFEQPKIVVPAIQNGVKHAFDDQGYYSNDKTSIIVAPDNEFILTVLNSCVSWWLTRQSFPSKQGGFYEFKPAYVSVVPIPPASPADKARLTKLAERAAKQAEAGDAAGLRATEREIDEIVYRLFDLTPDEIAHIEQSLAGVRAAGDEDGNDAADE